MDELLQSVTDQLNRVAGSLQGTEPDDLQALVGLMDITQELDTTAQADAALALFVEAAQAVHQVLSMLLLFQIDSEDDKLKAMSLVGEVVNELMQVAERYTDEPGYTGEVPTLLEGIRALTGEPAPDQVDAAATPPEDTSVEETEVVAPPVEVAPAEETPAPAADTAELTIANEDVPLVLDASLDASLVDDFISEATEHLDSIEESLLELEENPGDMEVINSIFRPFHTVKGVSGFLTLTPINRISHETENLLDAVRGGELGVSDELVDVVLASVDLIKKMVARVGQMMGDGVTEGETFPITAVIQRIKRLMAGQAPLESVPDASGDAAQQQAAPVAEPLTPEVLTEPANVESAPDTKAEPAVKNGGASRHTLSTIKVETGKLDMLFNLVGELVVAQLQVRQDPSIQQITDQRLQRNLAQLLRITNELQKTAMSTRMVPIRNTFQKMVRLVRDLSKKSGKQVELVMEGADTEIDRKLVEEIYEPIMHMVRNSMDHGIETIEQREATDKPEVGTITLSATHKGDEILIAIADDGKGLDPDRIRTKALERGLIFEGDTSTDKELYQLIFQPGFSTAQEVTDISGRGVGMDVVTRTIEKVRGRVELESVPGHGSKVTIHLPLTLAIIDGMVVRVGEQRYIIPTLSIVESFKPTKEDYTTVNQQGEAITVRGRLIPLVRLSRLFQVEGGMAEPWEGLVVVVESEGQRSCLMVDNLIGKQEIVIKSLGERMQGVGGLAGCAILGDGRIGLILDIGNLHRMARIVG